jgi:aryl-alcohol dehydrogenase-like predicted oxidoreductase
MNQIPLVTSPGTRTADMLYRTLGRTGERVSAIGMGGFHLAQHGLTEEESIRLVRAAIDRGITLMDNSWDYNEGQSELRMGKALKDGYRQKVFLMTKIDGRTKELAERQIETSLQVFRPITSICYSTMRLSDSTIPTAYSRKAELMKLSSMPGRQARSATSDSPGTRTRIFIYTC